MDSPFACPLVVYIGGYVGPEFRVPHPDRLSRTIAKIASDPERDDRVLLHIGPMGRDQRRDVFATLRELGLTTVKPQARDFKQRTATPRQAKGKAVRVLVAPIWILGRLGHKIARGPTETVFVDGCSRLRGGGGSSPDGGDRSPLLDPPNSGGPGGARPLPVSEPPEAASES